MEWDIAVVGAGPLEAMLSRQLKDAGLHWRCFADAQDAVRFAEERMRAGTPLEVVVIGPHLEQPMQAARRLHEAARAHLVFAPLPEALPALRRELALAPMIGDDWSVAPVGNGDLARIVVDSMRASDRRRRLRTTIDRANLRISAREPFDAARLRSLLVSDRYLSSILEQTHDLILALDERNRVAAMNRAAAAAFGPRVVGEPVQSLGPWVAGLQDALHEVGMAAVPVMRALGMPVAGREGERSFEVSVTAVRDDAGAYLGTALIFHDVTDARRALAAEQTARSQAEHLGRMKDEFLATLSHELRTPLSAILSWSQVLQMSRGEAQQRQGMEAIQRNARRQAKLIDDLLEISSILSGQPLLDARPVSLVDLAEAALSDVAAAAQGKQITLHRAYAQGLPAIHGDAKRLQQVLSNLLANAVKFTPSGGRVEILVGRSGAGIAVEVRDNGQGINPEFLPYLFERFRQADASIRRRHGGLGLGLSIAKELIELHGGRIEGRSPGPGQGATFTIWLPLDSGSAPIPFIPDASDHQAPAAPRELLAGLRVLVVEDEADTRSALQHILESAGARAHGAASAREGLEQLSAFTPDVMISDIGMPDSDGYFMIREVRSRGVSAAALPAIALTAYASKEDEERALAAGFQAHMAKPVDAHRLILQVSRLAKKKTVRCEANPHPALPSWARVAKGLQGAVAVSVHNNIGGAIMRAEP